MKAMTVGENTVLVLNPDEVAYIGHRLACSSFTSFDEYRQQTKGCPHPSRAQFYNNFKVAIDSAVHAS